MGSNKRLASIVIALVIQAPLFTAVADTKPNFQPVVRTNLADESIYFVMTDRFANGKADDPSLTGYKPGDIGYWHGGDFVGLSGKLDYIAAMGFSSIWITPPVVNAAVQGDSAGYHGYWGLDFTTIDPHLGTNSEFKEFIMKAHQLGLKVVVDIVVNHTADVIKYVGGNYSFRKLNLPPYKPSIAAELQNSKVPSWLNNPDNYHNRGNFGSELDSTWYGDFYGLDDLDTERTQVINGWIKVWSDWITNFDIDGYRIDTAKHVPPAFWRKFLPKIEAAAKAAGKRDFLIFGEVADTDSAYLATYLVENYFESVLDFKFQDNAIQYIRFPNQANRIIELFNNDDLYTSATTNAYSLATFLGNHDMGRTGLFINRATYGDAKLSLARAKLANEMLFLYRGVPVIYYGDEKGMAGDGGDKLARQSMFPTEVTDWQLEPRIGSAPIGQNSSFDVMNPLAEQITSLQTLIKAHPALRIGSIQLRTVTSSAIAFTRFWAGEEYLILINSGENEEQILPNFSSKRDWLRIYGAAELSDRNFTLPAISASIFKAQSAPNGSEKLVVKLAPLTIDYQARRWIAIKARVPGDEYLQVNFQMRVIGRKKWVNLGTSDHRTFKTESEPGGYFRVFIRPDLLQKGTQIEVVAIARGSSSKVAYSNVQKYRFN